MEEVNKEKESNLDEKKLAEKAKAEAEVIRKQLQPTIESLKAQNEEFAAKMKALEESYKAMAEEKAKIEKEKAEAEKTKEEEKKTLGQKFQEFSKTTDEAFKRMEEDRKKLEADFQKKLEKSKLAVLREKEIAKNNDILPEFHDLIPDPETTETNQEAIIAAINKAKEKSNALKTKFGGMTNQFVQQTNAPVIPSGDQHLTAPPPVDLSNLNKATPEEVEKLKEEMFKRFNIA